MMKIRLEGEVKRNISKKGMLDIKINGMVENKLTRVERKDVLVKGLFGWKKLGNRTIKKWGKYGTIEGEKND